MPDLQTLSYVRADLFAAMNPRIPAGAAPNFSTLPAPAGGGVSVADVVRCVLDVRPQADALRGRTAWVSIDTLDANADYSLTLSGTTVTFTASGSTAPQVLQGIADEVNGDATLQAAGITADVDGTTVVITSQPFSAFLSVDYSTTGSAVLAVEADAEGLQVFAMGRMAPVDDASDDGWTMLADDTGVPLVLTAVGGGQEAVLDVAHLSHVWAVEVGCWGHPDDGAGVTLRRRINLRPCRPTNALE